MLMKKNNFLLLVMMISFIMFGIVSNVSVLAVEFNPWIGFTVSSYSLFSDGAESATWDDLEFDTKWDSDSSTCGSEGRKFIWSRCGYRAQSGNYSYYCAERKNVSNDE